MEIEKDRGYKIIVGDLNFITNPALDYRGGKADRGAIGQKEQKEMEKELGIADV